MAGTKKKTFGLEGYQLPSYDGKLYSLFNNHRKSNLPKDKSCGMLDLHVRAKKLVPGPNAY